MGFKGFTNKTVDFAWGIRLNNNREWFNEHKEAYLSDFYRPMQELAQEVWQRVEKSLPEGTHIHLSRIYRDVRRAHGRGPYKDSLWFNIRRDYGGAWMESPVLFFEFSPEGYCYGLSTLMSKPETMRRFRERVDSNPAEFERLARRMEKIPGFSVEGEEYKRKKGDWGDSVMAKWYNRKKISFYTFRPPDGLMMSPELAEVVAGDFIKLLPLYEYVWELYCE
jgi:uncharacterized protein (TIGR02453 family)